MSTCPEKGAGRLVATVVAMALVLTSAAADADAGLAPEADAAQHAFDFDFGTWKTHSTRLLRPLAGSREWIRMDGVTVVRPIWGGRGNLAELESDGPQGHLSLISLRLYDPAARQWNLNFATSGVGILNVARDARSVPMIGRFEHGRGEFYDQETFGNRTIWVRFRIRPLSPTTARSEQAFSEDNGRTWETNWINDYTRVPEQH
ncbi:MAG: hypothetical protein PVS2B3_00580 [Steroidobacteraceae bacterium]